jgi:exoribonuclease R
MDTSDSHVEEQADLAELEFSPISPEDADDLDDRVYLLGVRPEFVNR